MLKHLYIRNFVLIDELEVQFNSGLSVITGETGAGKSIIFGALSLLKGKRADLSELKNKNEKSVIEARIDVSKYRLRKEFEAENLDYLEEAIFRRELSPQGKSRAFINDTPVRLEQMQALGDLLFDIHSQHQSVYLNDAAYRLAMIDQIAASVQELESYQTLYAQYKETERKLEQFKEQSRTALQEEDYLQFQFDEINKLGVQAGEEEELDKEHQLLSNGEQLLSTAEMVYSLLDGEDNATLTKLNQALQKMDEFSRLNPSMKEAAERFRSAYLELQDISSEIEGFKEDFEFDPQRLQFIEERLAEMHRLKNKHALDTADQLIELGKEIEQRLLSIANFEGDIAKLEYELSGIQKELLESAETLSQKRKASFVSLERSIANTLLRLGMPNAQFRVECIAGELSPTGIDKVDFLFSSNKGKDLQSIRKVASGGELSRIMLAIKREMASRKQMPALFFDEIDTGVSGEVADQLGNILREMGDQHQIISITHLPQLAAKGKSHYFVFKSSNELATLTNVKQLTEEERVAELAKMLSGEKISEAAVNNARELLAR